MIVDGKSIAKEMLASIRAQITVPVTVRAVTVMPTPATRSYLSIKKARAQDAGMTLEVVELEENASTEDVIRAVEKEGADAIIVQLPLPAHIDTARVLNAIPEDKDADVLSDKTYEHFEQDREGALLPPVVGAVKEIFERTDVSPKGQKALVIGKGKLVGKPVALWLERSGADVTVLTKESGALVDIEEADIIVSGAGAPHMITPEMLHPLVVLIDASTSESNGVVVGDADPRCAEVASVFTPVPGGVGPIAVACLFKNVAELVLKRSV